jgi:hypothetical protein
MRRVVTILLVWSLSPVGTVLNAALFYAVLVSLGARWNRPLLWVLVAIFVGACTYFDVRAYIARRKLGLTAYEAGEAVVNRMWGPPRTEEDS